MTLPEAYRHCQRITVSHYENFPVASRLLPAKFRKHIYPIYAFARYADDLADEYADREGLYQWRKMLHRCTKEQVSNPVFMALSDTIKKFDIPIALFDNLISAFLQDTEKKRYQNLKELLAYCKNSANPVGRIILHLHNYRDETLMQFSDNICTALQLTNFWQDVKVDLQKDRIYIPESFFAKYHLDNTMVLQNKTNAQFKKLIRELINITQGFFQNGLPLLQQIRGRFRLELKFTVLGGLSVLDKIEKINYNVLVTRPKLSKSDWTKIAINSLFNKTVSL